MSQAFKCLNPPAEMARKESVSPCPIKPTLYAAAAAAGPSRLRLPSLFITHKALPSRVFAAALFVLTLRLGVERFGLPRKGQHSSMGGTSAARAMSRFPRGLGRGGGGGGRLIARSHPWSHSGFHYLSRARKTSLAGSCDSLLHKQVAASEWERWTGRGYQPSPPAATVWLQILLTTQFFPLGMYFPGCRVPAGRKGTLRRRLLSWEHIREG